MIHSRTFAEWSPGPAIPDRQYLRVYSIHKVRDPTTQATATERKNIDVLLVNFFSREEKTNQQSTYIYINIYM